MMNGLSRSDAGCHAGKNSEATGGFHGRLAWKSLDDNACTPKNRLPQISRNFFIIRDMLLKLMALERPQCLWNVPNAFLIFSQIIGTSPMPRNAPGTSPMPRDNWNRPKCPDWNVPNAPMPSEILRGQ